MSWPLSHDYNEAIQDASLCFADPELRQGTAVCNALGLPVPCSGNFADVYAVQAGDRKWAVKCFTRQIPGLRDRYAHISAYLAQVQLPFMVGFQFLEQGIRIRGQWYPILKMDWVEGQPLNVFVREQAGSPAVLQALAQVWRKVDARLAGASLSHGDLQHGNVLLVRGAKAGALGVRLVDYDGMCVPALELLKSIEVGHPNFQHPQRLRDGGYGPKMDRFAHLVVYTAIRAVTAGGKPLWDKFDTGDNLLFRQADFESPRSAEIFRVLGSANTELKKLAGALAEAAQGPIDAVPTLTDLVGASQTTAIHAGPVTTVQRRGPGARPAATQVQPGPDPSAAADAAFPIVDALPARPRRPKSRGRLGWVVAGGAAVVLTGAVAAVAFLSGGSERVAPSVAQARSEKGPSVVPRTPPSDRIATPTGPVKETPDALPVLSVPAVPPEHATGRRPPPSAEGQQRAFRNVKLRIALDLAHPSAATFRAAGDRLVTAAKDSPPGSETRFACWVLARDLAARGEDLPLAFRSADALAEEYAVDALAARFRALELAAGAASRPAAQQTVAEAALGVLADALAADRFDLASSLQPLAQEAAGRSEIDALRDRVAETIQAVTALKEAYNDAGPALDVLRTNPQDPEANRKAGLWHAGWKDQWDRGLPLLALADDPALQAAARAELAAPTTAGARRALGDQWWGLADRQPPPAAVRFRGHAADWYAEALPGLSEADRTAVEARVKQVGDRPGRAVDLLKLVDVGRAPCAGRWSRDGAAVLSPGQKWSRLELPYVPPTDYVLTVRATRLDGNDAVGVGLIVEGRQCLAVVDAFPEAGGRHNLLRIDGLDPLQNEGSPRGPLLKNNAESEIVLTVHPKAVEARVDGKPIFQFQGDAGRLTLPDRRLTPPHADRLFLYGHNPIVFKQIELRPLSGRGRVVTYLALSGPITGGAYVSDLPLSQPPVIGHGELGTNGDLGHDPEVHDRRIQIKGEFYQKSLGMHPGNNSVPSQAVYRLDGKYRTFAARVGINDTAFQAPNVDGPFSPVVFSLLADGKEIWKSPGMQAFGETASCEVPVVGVQRLELRTTCPDYNNVHAVWIDPVVRR